MQIKNVLLILLGLGCLLLATACVEPQPQADGLTGSAQGKVSPGKVPAVPSDTQDYVHGWAPPTGDDSGKPVNPAASKADRERMLPSETDNYQRGWTFPTDESKTSEKPPTAASSRPDSPKVQAPDDTEEYLNGWTSE